MSTFTEHVPNFVPTLRHDTYPAIDPTKADLAGKYILITGASRGIGRAIAVAFAQAGASGIALLARSDTSATEAAVRAAQRPGYELNILSIAVDVTNFEETSSAVARACDTFSRLDVVVNNAGMAVPMKDAIAESDPLEWWRVWEVNVRGTYNVTKSALPFMLERGGAKTILNISSATAHWVLPRSSAYVISKFAILRFTEQLVAEYGAQGVLAIGLHPCSTPTELTAPLPQEIQVLLDDTPELAAHTIVWLVKERPEWLAGRYISSSWDVDEVLAKKDEIIAEDKLKLRMVV